MQSGPSPVKQPQLSAEDALIARWRGQSGDGVDARPLGELIRGTLSDSIVAQELPPGWRLSEERLASLFSVSRTPIREALAALANSQLATRDSRGTLRVATITQEQILDVYTVRRNLEGLSASLASEAAAPRDIARLRELNDAFRAAAEDVDDKALAATNVEFHAAIAEITGNELLMRFVEDVHNWVRRFATTTLVYPQRAAQATLEHAELIDAIEAHDGERAERLARDHMRTAQDIRVAMQAGDAGDGSRR